jgi:SAM-dependent methyltransferase
MRGNVEKWREAFQEESGWDNSTYRTIQAAEFGHVLNWILELKQDRYDILELGCGNGLLAFLICQELREARIDFSYQMTDLLPEAVEATELRFQGFSERDRLSFSTLDIYEIVEQMGAGSQSLIVSTGHASAATYRRAVPLVAQTLKPGGILICDFINHFSPRRFFPNVPGSLKRLLDVRRRRHEESMDLYHFGRLWIREFFAQSGLELVRIKGIGILNYPLLAMFEKA